MNQKPRKRYDADFKANAISLLESGKPVTEIAEELRISTHLVYSWKQASRRALHRELARLRVENDILKKAAIILGTKTPGNSAP